MMGHAASLGRRQREWLCWGLREGGSARHEPNVGRGGIPCRTMKRYGHEKQLAELRDRMIPTRSDSRHRRPMEYRNAEVTGG